MTEDAVADDAVPDDAVTKHAVPNGPQIRRTGPSVGRRLADDAPVLPEQSRDDTDSGWGERSSSNDDRLLQDRPPHWD